VPRVVQQSNIATEIYEERTRQMPIRDDAGECVNADKVRGGEVLRKRQERAKTGE